MGCCGDIQRHVSHIGEFRDGQSRILSITSLQDKLLIHFVVIKTIEIVADNFYACQRLQTTVSQFSNVLQLDQEESFHFGDRINTTLASMVTYTFTLALISTKTLKNF